MTSPHPRTRLIALAPVIVALLVVACSNNAGLTGSGDTATTSAAVTVPSSRPSPGGPTSSTTEDRGVVAFQRIPQLGDHLLDYRTPLPAYAADLPRLGSDQNPVTDAGATLGRVLFYDVNLSGTRGLSCASCHNHSSSFSDRTVTSLGNFGQRTRRNSMSLANAAFTSTGRYFWDERAASLEAQALAPFEDSAELDLSAEELLARITEQPYYQPLFDAAFDGEITTSTVAASLAQFMRAMVSFDSPYDHARAEVEDPKQDFPAFSDEENAGKRLFFTPIADGGGGCAGCHETEAFLSPSTTDGNNGLNAGTTSDLGVFEITGDDRQLASFRVASLRNVALTAPYMHDGRFRSLEEVIAHYSNNIQPHPNLSDRLQDDNGNPVRLDFDQAEQASLVAFLETLTDRTFIGDERFRDPFR